MRISINARARKALHLSGLRSDARKYPIKRDESGNSARKRAFAEFDEGNKPRDIFEAVGISISRGLVSPVFPGSSVVKVHIRALTEAKVSCMTFLSPT